MGEGVSDEDDVKEVEGPLVLALVSRLYFLLLSGTWNWSGLVSMLDFLIASSTNMMRT